MDLRMPSRKHPWKYLVKFRCECVSLPVATVYYFVGNHCWTCITVPLLRMYIWSWNYTAVFIYMHFSVDHIQTKSQLKCDINILWTGLSSEYLLKNTRWMHRNKLYYRSFNPHRVLMPRSFSTPILHSLYCPLRKNLTQNTNTIFFLSPINPQLYFRTSVPHWH